MIAGFQAHGARLLFSAPVEKMPMHVPRSIGCLGDYLEGSDWIGGLTKLKLAESLP